MFFRKLSRTRGLGSVHPSPISRCLLAGGIAVLLFAIFTLVDREFAFELNLGLYDDSDHAEIFYTLRDDPFHPRRSNRWTTRSDHTLNLMWAYRGLETPRRIRVDPRASPGRLYVGPLRVSGAGGDIELNGYDLLQWIQDPHQLELVSAERNKVVFRALGSDPHFHIRIPKDLNWPGIRWWMPRVAFAFVFGAITWLALQTGAAWLRRTSPRLHAHLRDVRIGHWTLVLLACAALTYQVSLQITDRHIVGDAIQNLRAAHNIYLHNTFSHRDGDDLIPTNFREPLPPFVTGAYLKLASLNGGQWSFEQLRSSELSRLVKLSNLIWVFLGLLATWLLAQHLLRSHFAAMLVTGFVFWFTFHTPRLVDTLYTELPAATLLLWTAYALLMATQRRSLLLFLAAGLLLGLLTLTKAAFLFVGAVAIPLIGVLLLLSGKTSRASWLRGGVLPSLTMLVGLSVLVAPWMVRNHLLLGDLEISQRAAVVYGRAVLNQMSAEEIKGVFYLYGPHLYQRIVAGTTLADLGDDFERGGRWQRLNRGASTFALSDREARHAGRPENAVSFHHFVSAEGVAFHRQLKESGHPNPDAATNDHFRDQGMRMILEQPGRHLMMSVPFFWKGFWSFRHVHIPFAPVHWQQEIVEIVNLLSGLALFGLFVLGVLRLRLDWVAVTLLPVGMLLLHALFTHNIPRYSVAAHPLMLLALAVVVAGLLQHLWTRLRHDAPGARNPSVPTMANHSTRRPDHPLPGS